MSVLIKICGLSTPETLDVALDAGADMVGFMFFPASPRNVSLHAARELGARVNGRAEKVAVTVDADDATLAGIVDVLKPDMLQLHGSESPERVAEIQEKYGVSVIKAIGVSTADDVAGAAASGRRDSSGILRAATCAGSSTRSFGSS